MHGWTVISEKQIQNMTPPNKLGSQNKKLNKKKLAVQGALRTWMHTILPDSVSCISNQPSSHSSDGPLGHNPANTETQAQKIGTSLYSWNSLFFEVLGLKVGKYLFSDRFYYCNTNGLKVILKDESLCCLCNNSDVSRSCAPQKRGFKIFYHICMYQYHAYSSFLKSIRRILFILIKGSYVD